jgi:hypothetical protein
MLEPYGQALLVVHLFQLTSHSSPGLSWGMTGVHVREIFNDLEGWHAPHLRTSTQGC